MDYTPQQPSATPLNQGNTKGHLSRIFVGSKAIWAIMLVLMSISLWIVFSATSTKAFSSWANGGSFFNMFGKHIISMLMAIVLCIGLSHMPLKYLRQYAFVILLISIIPLIYVVFRGQELNGATRQMSIFGISFQPSELVRLTLINYVASRLRLKEGMYDSVGNFWLIFGFTFLVCGIIFLDNISTAMILGGVVFYLSYIGGANRKCMNNLFLSVVGGITVMALAVMLIPALRTGEKARLGTGHARIERFVSQVGHPINTDTFDDISGKDLQVVSSQRAIANSHFFGVGFGKSEMRNLLPEPYSDFVFSIIIEEGGIPIACIVVLTYLLLFFAVGGIARRTNSVYYTLLSLGIGLIITLQAILHMLICVNLFPITGQNLPLISRGGSSYLVTGAYFGILLAVSKTNQENADKRIANTAGNSVVMPEAIPEMPIEANIDHETNITE